MWWHVTYTSEMFAAITKTILLFAAITFYLKFQFYEKSQMRLEYGVSKLWDSMKRGNR